MATKPPLQWPLEYYEGRPLCRCSNEQCSLAQRGLAYTWLDVHTPKSLCGCCDQEFEYLESHCTYARNQAAKGLSAPKGKGKGKGKQQVNIFVSGKGKSKGKAKGYEPTYYIGEKGKGNGNIHNNRNLLANLLDTVGNDILSPEQSSKIKVALETYGKAQHEGPIYPAAQLSESQELKQQLKHYDSKLSMQDNYVKQGKEKYCKLAYELKDQMDRVTQLVDDRTQLCAEREDIQAKLTKLVNAEKQQLDETYQTAISNMQDLTDLAHRMSRSMHSAEDTATAAAAPSTSSDTKEAESAAAVDLSKDDDNDKVSSHQDTDPGDDDCEDPYGNRLHQSTTTAPTIEESMAPSTKRAADNMSVPRIGSIASSIQAYEDAAARKKTKNTPRAESEAGADSASILAWGE